MRTLRPLQLPKDESVESAHTYARLDGGTGKGALLGVPAIDG
jgi:hypothetical protein